MERLKPAAAAELLRCTRAAFTYSGCAFVLEEISSRSWASATFTGARHRLCFRLEGAGAGAAADRFLATLHEAEFALRGHILADVEFLSEERLDGGAFVRVALEALTVEDA